jgi:hypothetical protein
MLLQQWTTGRGLLMTHTYTINPAPATRSGDLDGFIGICDACPERASFSIRQMTDDHMRSHAAYMERKTRSGRKAR